MGELPRVTDGSAQIDPASTRQLTTANAVRAIPASGVPLRFLAVHVALGVLAVQSVQVATLYAWLVTGWALWTALHTRSVRRVVIAAAYVSVSDVLWRAGEARFFYEGAKYVVAAVMAIALLRLVPQIRSAALPILYFALLLPSSLLTAELFGLSGARDPLSFNLAGPLALALSALFFLQVRCTWLELRSVFFVLLAPIIATASAAAFGTVTAGEIEFGGESELATSAGFGPNQVSVILSLGTLICLLLLVGEARVRTRVFALALGLALFAQAVLTFSRGGLFNLLVSGAFVLVLQLGVAPRVPTRLVQVAAAAILGVALFGQLNTFTGGALELRFADRSTSHRSSIAESDIELWRTHMLAGVGPGLSPFYRREFAGAPAHTEFTRVVAEHGLLGLLSLLALAAMIGRRVKLARTRWARLLTVALAAWALADMTHAAMRIAAPSFVLGLALMNVVPRGSSELSTDTNHEEAAS